MCGFFFLGKWCFLVVLDFFMHILGFYAQLLRNSIEKICVLCYCPTKKSNTSHTIIGGQVSDTDILYILNDPCNIDHANK